MSRRCAGTLAAAVLLLLAVPWPSRARIVDGIVAVVNGEPVTFSEVRAAAAEGLGIPVGDADIYLREEKDPARILRIIEGLVDSVLVRQELAALGQPVRDQDIDRAVESVRRGNNLTEEQFREALARDNLTLEGYRQRVRWQMERGAVVRARKLKDVTVTEEEMKAFLRENAERFLSGADVRLATLVLPLPEGGGEEAAVRLRIAAQQAAEHVRRGKTLEEASELVKAAVPGAAFVSSDFLREEDLMPEVRNEVRRLRTGETSSPFFTEAGGQIVTVLARRGGTPPDFSEVRGVVAEELTDRRSEKAYADVIAELRKNASIDVRL